MSAPLALTFVTSAPEVVDLPATKVEVAIIGRSNVGKSSLLNAAAKQKGLAKTSATPGRTQLLNLFKHDGGGTIVDLPGYGYASTSVKTRHAWRDRLERYLLQRKGLALVLLLIDGEVGPTKLDVEMVDWLRHHDVPFRIVATKHDKVKASKREKRKTELSTGCGVVPADVIWVSAEKNVGIDRLRAIVRETLKA